MPAAIGGMGNNQRAAPAAAGGLNLPLVPWEGGPAYWAQFSKANTAGWSSPSFFPIAIFLGDPSDASAYLAKGINTYMAVNHSPPLTTATSTGMFVIPNYTVTTPGGDVDSGWSVAEVGSNANAVGWFIYDEAEQGEGVYWDVDVSGGSGSTEFRRLSFFQSETAAKRALGDGRFMFANFGNGVMGSFWAPNTMDDFYQTVDAACIDKYAYTSPGVDGLFANAPNWPTGKDPQTSAAYGWFVNQMRTVYDSQTTRRPAWVFVETKKPYLGENPAFIITHAQLEGAVWAAIANEARGIAYFDYNGFYPPNVPATDPNTGSAPTTETHPILSGPSSYGTTVSTINSQITTLAPVINTQSYVWNFSATGLDTMLKAKDGFAYIFASVGIGGTTGSKTFTLPSGITGTTATVLNESRTVNISGGQFSDTFSNEYSHHTYKIPL